MFGSSMLDVAFGLVFVYLLLSIICTAANEIIAGLFRLRSGSLKQGIKEILAQQGVDGLADRFYDHPLIKSLSKGTKKPSYIPSRAFALTLVDLIGQSKKHGSFLSIDKIRAAVAGNLPGDSELRNILQLFLDDAGKDTEKVLANIEAWFNASMDRVAGWYKRKIQIITFVVAVAIVGALNADTLQIVRTLSVDDAVRQIIVAQAEEYIKQHPEGIAARLTGGAGGTAEPGLEAKQPAPSETIRKTVAELQQFSLPLGWQGKPKASELPNKILGLLLTVLAVSLGAPFWFDVLSKVSKIRSAGVPPTAAKPQEEKVGESGQKGKGK